MTRPAVPPKSLWSLLFGTRRRTPRRPHADGVRALDAMSPHQLADLPSLHEAG